MANDISFEENVTILLERIPFIRNLFSQAELRKARNFVFNFRLKKSFQQSVHKAYTLQEKCFVLISNFCCSKNSASAANDINAIKNIESITIRQIERMMLIAPTDMLDDKTINYENLASVLRNSPKEYRIYLHETRMTELEFDNFIVECSNPDFTDCRDDDNSDEELNEFIRCINLLFYFGFKVLVEKIKEDWSEEMMMCKLEIAQQLHSEYFNLFSRTLSIFSSDDEYIQTIWGLSLFARKKYESEIIRLLEYAYLYRSVYGEDWMRTIFVNFLSGLNPSERLSFVNFLNLSVEDGGSPYAEAFCDAMEQYCYENSIEPAIPLNLVNRRTAKLVRNGSGGEYVRVLNRKLKGVNEDPAKEDRILYDNLKKLHYKLIEDGILDKTADEELFIFRLSGLNKPGKLSNLKVKNSIKLGLVLRCLCSDRNNPFPRTKLGSFFITDAGNEPNFSSNTIVTQMEMKKPTPKSNFHYVVTLLEEIGFANVRDVHNGARS